MLTVLMASFLMGCPSPDSGKDSSATTDTWTLSDLAGACLSEERLGGFEVVQWDSPDDRFSTVTGYARDGVVPAAVFLPRESEGDCTLYQKQNPFCDPPCKNGQACSLESQCVPYPIETDLGTVTIQGLEKALSLAPDPTFHYWTTDVPWPLFQPGAQVSLSAPGSVGPALSLRGIGVEPLVTEASWTLQSGVDGQVSWTPESGESRIVLSLNVDQHGSSPITLICDTADDGSLTIPGGLIATFLSYGMSGFTSSSIVRRTADHVDTTTGCVEFLVYSQITGQLTIQGAP